MVKTGGLGDVIAALPRALQAIGHDVRVLLPGYPAVLSTLSDSRQCARLPAVADLPAADLKKAGGHYYVIDCPELYDRAGGPYQDEHGRDWADNALRFGHLSRAAAVLALPGSPLPWRPDVLHLHDWQAAIAAAYLGFTPRPQAPAGANAHNLAAHVTF